MEKQSSKRIALRAAYPVIFTEVETNTLIEVPDLGILTEANDESGAKGTIADAIAMARDAIRTHIITAKEDGREIQQVSRITEIDAGAGTFAGEGDSFVSLVDVGIADHNGKIRAHKIFFKKCKDGVLFI